MQLMGVVFLECSRRHMAEGSEQAPGVCFPMLIFFFRPNPPTGPIACRTGARARRRFEATGERNHAPFGYRAA